MAIKVNHLHIFPTLYIHAPPSTSRRPSVSMMVCASTFRHASAKAMHTMPLAAFHGVGHVNFVHGRTHHTHTRTHTHIHALPNSITISYLTFPSTSPLCIGRSWRSSQRMVPTLTSHLIGAGKWRDTMVYLRIPKEYSLVAWYCDDILMMFWWYWIFWYIFGGLLQSSDTPNWFKVTLKGDVFEIFWVRAVTSWRLSSNSLTLHNIP